MGQGLWSFVNDAIKQSPIEGLIFYGGLYNYEFPWVRSFDLFLMMRIINLQIRDWVFMVAGLYDYAFSWVGVFDLLLMMLSMCCLAIQLSFYGGLYNYAFSQAT